MNRLRAFIVLAVAAVALMAPSAQLTGVELAVVSGPEGTEQFEARPGETVELAVRAADAGAIAGIQFDILFNVELARAQDVTVAEQLPSSFLLEYRVEPGAVHVALVGNEAIGREQMTLIRVPVVVNAQAGQTVEFTIANAEASDVDGQSLGVTTIPGVLTVVPNGQTTGPTATPSPQGTPTPTATPTLETPPTATPTPGRTESPDNGNGGCVRGMVAAGSVLRGEGALFASLLGLVALRARLRK